MLFRDGGAEPTHLDDFLPDAVMMGLVIIIQNFAHMRGGALGRQEFPCFISQKFLIVGKIEIHVASPYSSTADSSVLWEGY